MTRDEVEELIVVLNGYWPRTSPEVDDHQTVTVWWRTLHEIPFEAVADAVVEMVKAGREFCPEVPAIYHAATVKPPPVPPYYTDFALDPGDGETLMGIPVPSNVSPKARAYIDAAKAHTAAIAEKRGTQPDRRRPNEDAEAAARWEVHEAAIAAADDL